MKLPDRIPTRLKDCAIDCDGFKIIVRDGQISSFESVGDLHSPASMLAGMASWDMDEYFENSGILEKEGISAKDMAADMVANWNYKEWWGIIFKEYADGWVEDFIDGMDWEKFSKESNISMAVIEKFLKTTTIRMMDAKIQYVEVGRPMEKETFASIAKCENYDELYDIFARIIDRVDPHMWAEKTGVPGSIYHNMLKTIQSDGRIRCAGGRK